jgi:hypothetical protein
LGEPLVAEEATQVDGAERRDGDGLAECLSKQRRDRHRSCVIL